MYLPHSLTPVIGSVKRFCGKNCIFSENHSSAHKIHILMIFVHTVRTGRGGFMRNKELSEAEKKDLAMKMEIAAELGLLEKVEKFGWKGLTSRESGRIGGIMGQRKSEERKKAIYKEEKE